MKIEPSYNFTMYFYWAIISNRKRKEQSSIYIKKKYLNPKRTQELENQA